ncbi:hypothetical protein AciM339_0219 [Aciduliprofundum sp. MAR08-339]|uniref:hypothetical protein n=1 Tax=Aciduliprofundum sp. (strain MAR08-339) TaxID=673860 RepID=UPI0002A4B21A|nr:hypothetical protein AciM339_0187 [Aciduliprofundum sp. MAR08-339]AGB04116.1 hypothetical protein AciM339_0219 [Aciduliprofundum sp. MAR08-339]
MNEKFLEYLMKSKWTTLLLMAIAFVSIAEVVNVLISGDLQGSLPNYIGAVIFLWLMYILAMQIKYENLQRKSFLALMAEAFQGMQEKEYTFTYIPQNNLLIKIGGKIYILEVTKISEVEKIENE